MTSKTFLNYCKYSGIWISFALNPYHWRFSFEITEPDGMDPEMYILNIACGPINLRAILDDGSW